MELGDFDSVMMCMPDIHSVPRGKVMFGAFKDGLAKANLDMLKAATMLGPNSGLPSSATQLRPDYGSRSLRPCVETLTPWPWLSDEGRRVGSVLCDMYLPDGSPDLTCPRQLLKSQLNALWERHGLVIKTGFEYEFYVFKQDSLEPLGSDSWQKLNLREWGKHRKLFNELRETIEGMGTKIVSVEAEMDAGQWELITSPAQGVDGADRAFYVKNAVKGFFHNKGYDATFMSRPTVSSTGGALHLNHSLWRPGGSTATDSEEEGENVFVGNKGGLSPAAKHWIAGLLTHGPALTALLCPTVNCYHHLHTHLAPSLCTWGMDDRNALIRVRSQDDNVFLENRLVSGPASPYLALAATVAAGMDGLERGLHCPDSMTTFVDQPKLLPTSLDQALTALEEDQHMVDRLGSDFVSTYVSVKREMEVAPLQGAKLKPLSDQLALERSLYFATY